MDLKVFMRYMSDCEVNDWAATIEGLKAYEQQSKLGLRERWENLKNKYEEVANLC